MPKPEIAELPASFKWRPGLVTDPIDMDHILEQLDPRVRTQVIVARFENVAALHRTLAEGAAKIAGILASGKRE